MADERVANRHFVEVRQATELHQIVEIEIVAGVDTKTEGVRELRRPRISGERLAPVHVAALERAGEGFRVQLDPMGAHFRRPANGRLFRIDEQADANAVVAQV